MHEKWHCSICDKLMNANTSASHLGGRSHKEKIRSTQSSNWRCSICKTNMNVANRNIHLESQQHKEKTRQFDWYCTVCDKHMQMDNRLSHINGRAHLDAFSRVSIMSSVLKTGSLRNVKSSPIDNFFESQRHFVHDRELPLAKSITRLLTCHNIKRESKKGQKILGGYYQALADEFNMRFGCEEQLGSLQALCRILSVKEGNIPSSITQCKQVCVELITLLFLDVDNLAAGPI